MELDSNVRRVSNGTALLGGSPFRLIRLSAAGARLLDGWLAGDTGEVSLNGQQLRDRLVRAGMIHPIVRPTDASPLVAFVVPVHDDLPGLVGVLAAIRESYATAPIIVVDDASPAAEEIALAVTHAKATLVRHEENRGPGAARNSGWRRVADDIEVVFFVDADVLPERGALTQVLAHFGDEACIAAAPRVRAANGRSAIDSYEVMESPLDMGVNPGRVGSGLRTSYLPSAALAVRRSALEEADGFDERMRFGEDVDLVWQLTEDDNTVRYDPSAVVHHRNRCSVGDLARQRFGYGSSAAPLAARHQNAVTPLRLPATMLAGWLAALFGGPAVRLAALGGGVVSVVTLAKKLEPSVAEPQKEAARLLGQAHVGIAGALVNAATRSYAPVMLVTRPTRRALLASVVLPPAIAWLRSRPRHDPVTHIALKTVDNASYCAGVWAGAWRERSPAALLPHVSLPKKQDD